MRYFLKLNALSTIFALLPFMISELLVNVYRINRITGIEIANVNWASAIISLLGLSLSTVIFAIMIKRFLPSKKANFLSSITWIPYYWLYVHAFAVLFPFSNQADAANPISGLIIIAGLLLYPFLLAGVNVIALFSKKQNELS